MRRSILIIEDNAPQARHTMQALKQRGFEVAWATSGLHGLEMARKLRPDVVLLDVVMPDLDGLAVCRWIKENKHTRGAAVIMLTARSEVSDRVKGLEIGADAYLPKPFDLEELEARITSALRTRLARSELQLRNEQLESMLDRLATLAMTDPLTGLCNRRRFVDALAREVAACRRAASPLSCVMIDLDHFKAANDQHGHAAGDSILVTLAEIIRMNLRRIDVAARLGGEELALLLPCTPKGAARQIAERIAGALRAHVRELPTGMLRASASFGIAETTDVGDDGDALVQAADAALYEAKRSGRDRIVLFDCSLLPERRDAV